MPFVFNTGTSSGEEMSKANLSSQINGSNTVFTVPSAYSAGTLRVYFNGIRQIINETFNETTSNTFTLTFTPVTGDFITIDYIGA